MKILITTLSILVIVPLVVMISLALGSLIRWINEGKNFKSPIDNQEPIGKLFTNKEFYKTLITGFFVFYSLYCLFTS